MWNSPKMWNRTKEVEQAQRGGTGPKRWNSPRGGTGERSATLVSASKKKKGVALNVEQAFDMEQPKDV